MKRHFMLGFLCSVILAGSVIAVGVYFYSRDIIDSMFRYNLDSTTRQLAVILRQYDKIFNAFQVELNREGRVAILKVHEEVKDNFRNLSPEELGVIASRHGLDEICFINREGFIFNTSFPPEMNINLFHNSIFQENYLRSIYGKDSVFTPRAMMGSNSGSINKYIYYSPAGSDYILSAAYNFRNYISRKYSANYYELMSLNKLAELAENNAFLEDIELVTAASGSYWSLLKVGHKLNLPTRFFNEVMKEKQIIVQQGNKTTVYTDVSEQSEMYDIYDSAMETMPRILILTYDLSARHYYLRNLIIFIATVLVISTLLSFLGVSWYFNRKYFSRIATINAGLNAIAGGDYETVLACPGNDEFSAMVENINRMAAGIRERESELRRSEKRFRSIFEYAPVGIAILGMNRQMRYFNRAFLDIIGYASDELVNRDYLQLLTEDEAPKVIKVFNSIAHGMKEFDVSDRRLISKDGCVVLASVTAAPIKDETNRPAFMMLMVNDITERRQIEQQLLQVQKMDAVGKLAGGVAHDFNNLLQVIIGYKTMISRYLQDHPQGMEFWENVMTAASRAKALARQLLAFGRFQPSAERRRLDPNAVTQSFMKMLSRVLGEDIEIELSPEGNIPMIYADEAQMEQVLMNLCVNARDAMPNGGLLRLTVRLAFVDENKARELGSPHAGHYVRLSVIDNGTGMTDTVKKHLFEPFFTTKAVGKGTGIGLATVAAIIKSHGGFIEVDSQLGRGTSFHVYLPTLSERQVAEHPEQETEKTVSASGHGELILLCEDESQVRELANLMLTDAGYSVLVAEDGELAEILFEKNRDRIDLVLLDMIMPKKSGRHVFKHIRNSGAKVPILFTTGYSNETLSGELGENVINKPYTEDELLSRIRDILNNRKAPESDGAPNQQKGTS